MITLNINGKTVTVDEGTTVLDAATSVGIAIPTLCHHPKLTPYGGCRMCLVEIKGMPRLVTSCTTPVAEGMEVVTASPRLKELRISIMKLLLSDHPNECLICEKSGDCLLQSLAHYYGISENEFEGERRAYEKRDGNPFINRNMEKCILCGRCVNVCREIQGVDAIDFAYRGFKTKICPAYERDLDCEFCGQCIRLCPTGALSGKNWTLKEWHTDKRRVETVCPYCGTGCNIVLHIRGNNIVKVTTKSDSWNEGWLCVKGTFGFEFVGSPDRLKTPLIKKRGKLKEASWDEALEYTAKKLKTIKKKFGPDSIGGLSSARCTTEENYLFQKFMRAALGTNNVDHCARL
jgi:predicted molibdopterin-dependent oxidoreductase YjgC